MPRKRSPQDDSDDPFDAIWRSEMDFFREVQRMFESLESADGSMPPGAEDGTGVGPIVRGYSVTMGPDGRPVVRTFGNIKDPALPNTPFSETREPLIDVIEGKDEVKVIAEMPGVRREDISVRRSGDKLILSVDAADRRYHKEVDLPPGTSERDLRFTYNNGVLEVILPLRSRRKT